MATDDLAGKIEAALDIADKMKQFDSKGSASSINYSKDQDLLQRAIERKEKIASIHAEMQKKKEYTDENFIKDNLRRLSELGMETLEVLKDEIQTDPSGRMAECMSSLANSTVNSLKELKEYDNDKKKLQIEEEKLNIRKSAITAGGPTNNVLIVGKMTDVMKAIKDQEFSNMKEAETISAREVYEDSGPGTDFKKDNG